MTNIPPYTSTTHPPLNPEQDYMDLMFGRGKGDPDGYNDGIVDIVVLQDLDIAELLKDRPF